ncbi:MAG: type II toxin-antitoxin system RelE/ParE family toxin [Nitrospirota bacterium]
MRLIKFRHKGLLRLYTEDNPKGVSASHLDKVGKLLLALETTLTLEQAGCFPGWKLHPLKGDMKGYWSVTVTGTGALCSAITNQQTPPATLI